MANPYNPEGVGWIRVQRFSRNRPFIGFVYFQGAFVPPNRWSKMIPFCLIFSNSKHGHFFLANFHYIAKIFKTRYFVHERQKKTCKFKMEFSFWWISTIYEHLDNYNTGPELKLVYSVIRYKLFAANWLLNPKQQSSSKKWRSATTKYFIKLFKFASDIFSSLTLFPTHFDKLVP